MTDKKPNKTIEELYVAMLPLIQAEIDREGENGYKPFLDHGYNPSGIDSITASFNEIALYVEVDGCWFSIMFKHPTLEEWVTRVAKHNGDLPVMKVTGELADLTREMLALEVASYRKGQDDEMISNFIPVFDFGEETPNHVSVMLAMIEKGAE